MNVVAIKKDFTPKILCRNKALYEVLFSALAHLNPESSNLNIAESKIIQTFNFHARKAEFELKFVNVLKLIINFLAVMHII